MTERTATVVRFLSLIALYVAGDALGELLIHSPDQVTLVWVPAGVSLAALILFGRRYWPFIPIAELIVQSIPELTPLSFIAYTAAANTLSALAAAELVRRLGGARAPQQALRSSSILLLAALVLALVSALIGVFGLWQVGYVPSSMLDEAFGRWVVANFFGVLLVTPAVVLWAQAWRGGGPHLGDEGLGSRRELVIWIGAVLLSLLILIQADRTTSDYVLGLSSLPLALLIWAALRFPPLYTAIASLLVGLSMAVLAGLGLAGFSQPRSLLDAVILLTFLSVIAVVPLLLGEAADSNRRNSRRLLRRARTDDLTGLPNRVGFEAAARARGSSEGTGEWALIYLDLDHFKLVNDSAGHAAGDELVQGLAGMLRSQLSEVDLLARIGGDEFAVLLTDRSRDEVETVAQQLRAAVSQYRFPCQGHVFSLTASLGVVAAHGADYAHMLAQADTACFTAKELGGNRVQWGSGDEAAVAARSSAMRWAVRINEGIEQDNFRVFCQSIVPLGADQDHGRHFEVLIRLHDPESGQLLSPGQFVPAAERFRMGPKLDRHVLDRTLRWLEQRPDWAAQVDSCSINLCAASVEDAGFVDYLHRRLADSSVSARKLCFEITETSAVRDLGEAQRFIDGVRALGCRLALDDFGAGFCSFAYLHSLDVDYFKIDGSFIRQLGNSALSQAIVKSISDIAHSIDKQTVAEFVESEAIREQLRTLGVDYAQGYAIDAPRPIEQYFADLRATRDASAKSA